MNSIHDSCIVNICSSIVQRKTEWVEYLPKEAFYPDLLNQWDGVDLEDLMGISKGRGHFKFPAKAQLIPIIVPRVVYLSGE